MQIRAVCIVVAVAVAVSSQPVNSSGMCKLPKDPSIHYRCVGKGASGTKECESSLPAGTIVTPECNSPNYYSNGALALMRCVDGHWDYVARCNPECGIAGLAGGAALDASLETVGTNPLPWYVSIYDKKNKIPVHICGGSLLTTKIVISAAHCFWNNNSKKQPAANYEVVVGKTSSDQPDDERIQRSDVKVIHTSSYFLGLTTSYQNDIAVLELREAVRYTPFVMPVCINFDLVFEKQQLREGNKGQVAGFNLHDRSLTRRTLKTHSAPYLPIEECFVQTPPDFRQFITSDKICTMYPTVNGSSSLPDGGAGLSFPEAERGIQRHYLRGVVSVAPNQLNTPNTPIGYTLISRHEELLKPLLLSSL